MKKRNHLMFMTMALVAMIAFGCKKSEETAAQNTASSGVIPASLFLTEAPSHVTSIASLKASAKEGDTVTIKAAVGGRKQVFVANRAVMTVVDASLTNPCTAPGHQCPAPWDYCCTPPEQLLPQTASVQIVDSDKRPLSIDLNTVDELKPLNTLVIQGTVGRRPDDTTLVINATGIYVVPQQG